MKKFLLSLCILFTAQIFATNSSSNDTIKIVIKGDIIQIEADNTKEIEELLKHDIQQLFQNIYLNLSDQNDSSNVESLQMELYIQGDSSAQKIVLETDVDTDTEEIIRKVKNVIKISDEGVQIVQREQVVEEEEDDNIIQLLTEIKNNIDIENEEEQEEDKDSRTISMTEIHLGFNNYFNAEQQIPSGVNYDVKPINSLSFSYNKYAKTRIFAKGPLFLKYGIGLTSNNYKFSEPVQLVETEDEIQFVKHEGHDVKKSKLATLFVDVPLMLQIDLSKDKTEEGGFNIAAGPYVGYMLKSKSKYVYSDANGNDNKDKEKGDFYVNKIRYGIQGQMGILGLNFIARYELSTLFEDQKGPEKLNAFNFGIVFDL